MAVAPDFTPVNHDDEVINRVQDHLTKTLDPLTASPLNGAVLVKNVALKLGANVIPHNLGLRPRGWEVVRNRSTAAPIDWTEFPAASLASSFAQFGAAGDPTNWNYKLDGNGVVWFRGTVKTGTSPASTITSSLPAALRPAVTHRIVTLAVAAATGIAQVDVTATGAVNLVLSPGVVAPYTYIVLATSYLAAGTPPAPTFSDQLDTQPEDPTKVIRIISSAATTVDLLVF